MINIGMVNELAIMCERLGVDVWEVIDAAATKPFGFMKFTPGPGLGGHCIPIDPLYLSWKMKALNYNARFIELASEINTNMPRYVVHRMLEAMNDRGKVLKGSKVLVLGVAYKPDIDDVRESPALDVIGMLQNKGAEVVYHDPYIPHIHHEYDGWEMDSVEDMMKAVKEFGCGHYCDRSQRLRLCCHRRMQPRLSLTRVMRWVNWRRTIRKWKDFR